MVDRKPPDNSWQCDVCVVSELFKEKEKRVTELENSIIGFERKARVLQEKNENLKLLIETLRGEIYRLKHENASLENEKNSLLQERIERAETIFQKAAELERHLIITKDIIIFKQMEQYRLHNQYNNDFDPAKKRQELLGELNGLIVTKEIQNAKKARQTKKETKTSNNTTIC